MTRGQWWGWGQLWCGEGDAGPGVQRVVEAGLCPPCGCRLPFQMTLHASRD